MTRLFECERCGKVYRNNKNTLMMEYACYPDICPPELLRAESIKLYSSEDDGLESDYINLCDECMTKLSNFLSNKEE